MSTVTGETPSLGIDRDASAPTIPHQSNSWPVLSRAWSAFRRWGERHGQRRALAELAGSPHLLDDIGVTRTQAQREAKKPFWQR